MEREFGYVARETGNAKGERAGCLRRCLITHRVCQELSAYNDYKPLRGENDLLPVTHLYVAEDSFYDIVLRLLRL